MNVTKKIVKFDHEVRENLREGVEILANAVKVTMGPKGKIVLIERQNQHPIVTKDGVTVAKSINLSNKFQNLGVQIVKDAASRSADEAGDGTTTATVLTQAIFEQGLRMLASGEDAVTLRKGIEKAASDVVEQLLNQSKDVQDQSEIKQVAMISCNGEEEIADLITSAIAKVGPDGSIIVENAKGFKSSLGFVEGVQIDRGYLSPYFATDQDKLEAVLEKSYVLLCNKKLMTMQDILKPLEAVLETGKPVLIVANDIGDEVLQALVLNRVKGALKVCAIKSPGFGNVRHDMLQDMACLTGARVFDETDDLSDFDPKDLGYCKKIMINRVNTLIISDKKNSNAVSARIDSIRQQLAAPTLEADEAAALEYRAQQLAGGIAILRVGAATEAEMIERRDRVDDALHATRAALSEGIVAGGGVSLIKASSAIQCEENELAPGYSIIKNACLEPIKQIVENTGKSAELVIEKLTDKDEPHWGYDARKEIYGDMFDLGIIDPAKVVRCALQNASSAASLLLTVDCTVTEEISS